jgi:hypothetical protein
MNLLIKTVMPLEVDTRDVSAVQRRVAQDYWLLFPSGDQGFVARVFPWALDSFQGRHPDYLPIDARYHDLEHTLQGTLCFSTLLRQRAQSGALPEISEETFQLGLLAVLLHDTGYLKLRDDPEGTGAKYTATHVNRSCDFAERLLLARGFTVRQVHAIQNMIRCTGLGVKVGAIPYHHEEERIAGYALGTADLVGQMAAVDYIDKLPLLFGEFAESAAYNVGRGGAGQVFTSPLDLMRKTPGFWTNYVLPKLEGEFLGLYRFLAPGADQPNGYLDRIRANLARLERQLAQAA